MPSGSDAFGDSPDAGLRFFSSEIHKDVAAEYCRSLRDHRSSACDSEVVMLDANIASNQRRDFKRVSLSPEIFLSAQGRHALDLMLRVFGRLRSGESVKGDVRRDDMPVGAADLVEEHR